MFGRTNIRPVKNWLNSPYMVSVNVKQHLKKNDWDSYHRSLRGRVNNTNIVALGETVAPGMVVYEGTPRLTVTDFNYTHTHTHCVSLLGSRWDQEEGGGAGWTLSPEEIMSREVELGCESWISFASSCSSTAVQRTLSLWLCPSTAVETAIAQCTSRWTMARGHRLNNSIVLAAVHGLSGLFRAVSAVEPSLFRPLPPPPPPLSPSLISILASVDVKQNGLTVTVTL